jgi:hypothetical protein
MECHLSATMLYKAQALLSTSFINTGALKCLGGCCFWACTSFRYRTRDHLL